MNEIRITCDTKQNVYHPGDEDRFFKLDKEMIDRCYNLHNNDIARTVFEFVLVKDIYLMNNVGEDNLTIKISMFFDRTKFIEITRIFDYSGIHILPEFNDKLVTFIAKEIHNIIYDYNKDNIYDISVLHHIVSGLNFKQHEPFLTEIFAGKLC